jgi:murein DD-endopeptidase MepM/ murein hydrolase activator NlpD
LHTIIIILTALVLVSNVAAKISSVSESKTSTLSVGNDISGTDDLLVQGGNISTVLTQEATGIGLNLIKYTVENGDTLDSVAAKYGVTPDTIQWASSDIMNPFSTKIEEGWVLTIPEGMNGVLYHVRQGQTLDNVIAETSITNDEANRFNIIEFNQLKPPYDLTNIDTLFIPDGNLKKVGPEGELAEIPRGVFTNPLSDPACKGYAISRGFTYYHNGVDMAKWDGCPVSAVANGLVEYAGWASQGQGYMVRVDHGGGIKTEYFHGNGTYYVKVGDRVRQGQNIMQMGSTGNSTGTHVHVILWKDKVAIDPEPYIPVWPE